MKTFVISTVTSIVIVTIMLVTGWFPVSRIYPSTARVTNISGDLVTVVDGAQHIYAFWGAEDWRVGDVCSLLFNDNHTPGTVVDDKILQVRYAGSF